MDSSNWINLGILVVAAIAALIAWLGVRDARKARDSAREYEQSDADTAKQSATEHKRTADALERQAAVAEAAAEIRPLWEFSTLDAPTSDQRWTVKNISGEHAYNVHLGSPSGFDADWLELPGGTEDAVAPGATIAFTFLRRLSSPTSATVSVFWTSRDGSPQKQFTETIN